MRVVSQEATPEPPPATKTSRQAHTRCFVVPVHRKRCECFDETSSPLQNYVVLIHGIDTRVPLLLANFVSSLTS